MKKFLLSLAIAFSCFAAQAADNNAKVIVSIKPLHSLVANVMGETGSPALLVSGKDSPHDFQFRPSQMELVNNAEVIFYIDDSIETFLKRPLEALPSNVVKVKLSGINGLGLLDQRSLDVEAGHAHSHDEHDNHTDAALKDYHFWLSPKIAITLVNKIAEELSKKYPENAGAYKTNAEKTISKLKALDNEVAEKLKPENIKPFLLFHDAFQYFETSYGLKAKGFVSLDPTQPPSIGHVKEIRNIIKKDNIACIFTEPQFNKKSVSALADGKNIYIGELDENGALLEQGKDLYFNLIRHNAASYTACK